jgi:fatty-acid peroxygenase|tara:strand:+ start:7350 stop:8621 length:1272 start_codon:yes stop_codon:yes gene_type:complete
MSIPRLASFDSTLAFFREGYDFVGNRCRETSSDAFRTRIMLRKVVCMRGADAARQFYDGEHFTRAGSMPPTTLRLLQDKGSVQQCDGAHHRARKAMFLGLLTGPAVDAIVQEFEVAWQDALPDWRARPSVVLHEEMQRLLCKAACAWAGIPLTGRELSRRTAEMAAMIDSAGAVSPKVLRALLLRRRSEAWARRAILRARAQEKNDAPVSVLAHHREPDGNLLDLDDAAVELLNLIRPTVAVARFITFAALALHEHPGAVQWLEEDPERRLTAFVHEVRRFYPFFPVIGGRVRQPFEWRGHYFVSDDWVLLGLYATNHDPALWGDPQAFRPARFYRREPSAFDLVPQGGGDHAEDHRCPGEWFTIALIGRALGLLQQATWGLPQQDLSIALDRFPTLPATGLVVVFARGRPSLLQLASADPSI